ncbi:MAG: hypothetical protein ACI9S8_002633 [Chlamydiales bacterium]|jgi:hypothetical protein
MKMKKKKRNKTPEHDLETIIPLLISQWRKLRKIHGGPEDVLQTRELRRASAVVKHLFDGTPHPDGKTYSESDLIGGHLLYEWIVRYQEGLSLITEIPTPPRRVLDLCGEVGAFSFAASQHGASDVHLLDIDELNLRLAGEIHGRYGHPITVHKKDVHQKDVLQDFLASEKKFDLIILGYALNELFPSTMKGWAKKQNAFVESLMDSLSDEGHILVVENSWTASNKRVLQLREDMVEKGIPVQAPCIWTGKCPALQNTKGYCFAQRELAAPHFFKQMQKSAQIKAGSVKMSYLLLKNPKSSWPKLPDERLYRVISPQLESYHGARYHLCGVDGGKTLGSHITDHPKESRSFEYVRRGDIISVSDLLEDKDRLEIIEGSTVEVRVSCGKALPSSEEDLEY